MKRYRFLRFFIDSTRSLFHGTKTGPLYEKYREEQREYIGKKYGINNFDEKFDRWLSVPKPVLSVVDEHTHLLQDIEDAYVGGSFYSALTGSCCLGERIFNQIILRIRDSFKSNPYYKQVYRKDSINDWGLGIDILVQWKIIDASTESKYRRLATLRTESVHFQSKEQDLLEMSKEAVELINKIVADLFELKKERGVLIWFEVPGELYLKKVAERDPFIREFYLPSALLVGYKHKIDGTPDLRMVVVDKEAYPSGEISDEEFVKLRNEYNAAQRT